ncbi:DUF4293 domain-containing protein [Pedobacter sp.]|uniref:DUF4293 domain-containing protein n=1 Tax=Pedobacter sp. TaxID=1411316 RepID=UPI00396C8F8A
MIQRIQSVWLLMAAITLACLCFAPLFTAITTDATYIVMVKSIDKHWGNTTESTTNVLLLTSTALAALINLVNIFNYRNRTLQKRIIFLNILLIIVLSFWFSQLTKQIPGTLTSIDLGIGIGLPLVSIIFNFLAIRGINHDEKLIRSADRLR